MNTKISYNNMKLKVDQSFGKFNFRDHEISVLKYLPMSDKYDLLMITLQKAEESGIYNPLKIDMYFHLHLIYMYTNLSFTEKQKEDELKIYDTLKSNGFIDAFINALDEEEYNYLFNMMNELIENSMKYRNSAASVIQTFVEDLPKNAQAAADIVDSFDKEKFSAVVDFAEAANGGRPIRGLRANISPIDEVKNN